MDLLIILPPLGPPPPPSYSPECGQKKVQQNSSYPDAGYPDRYGPSGKSVENSIKPTCLEITAYRIKYSTVLWLLELQIRRGRKF
jgi:hypothetical protein